MLYVSEIELKSLIIRIKNTRITNMRKCYVTNADDSEKNILANNYIDNRVRLYNKLSNLSFDNSEQNSKLKRIRNRLKNQILKSGTSIGANVHEANYAQSKADFVSKLQIALKECYETEYWLELFSKTNIIDIKQYSELKNDCGKIRRILISSVNTTKEKYSL